MNSPSNSTDPTIVRPVVVNSAALAFDRRTLLMGGGLVAAGLLAAPVAKEFWGAKASVFIARNQKYDGPLTQTIRDGLVATGLDPQAMAGKRVLLKPNLVEPSRAAPHMTTHPAVILATAEVFRGWGAMVRVGEGPGHVRDTEMALVESGVQEALDSANLEFVDLNYDEVGFVENRGRASKLPGFYFPRAVIEADLVVSLPKMKTHHWVGVTAAMKNLYGVIPGIKYGWPKNVLHHAGIPQTVFDINASLTNTIAVVDGIDCMEGDGPIMGSLKPMGLLVMGTVPAAVDATICRLMELDPWQVDYLRTAEDRLGPLAESRITQRGETWRPLAKPFEILNKPWLRKMRTRPGVLVS